MQTATERNGEAVLAGTVEAGYLLLSGAFQATENQRDKCCFRAKEMRDQPLAPSILQEGFGMGWATPSHRHLPSAEPHGDSGRSPCSPPLPGQQHGKEIWTNEKKEGLLCPASEFHLPPSNMQNHPPLQGPLII